jgi:hypothetical protein
VIPNRKSKESYPNYQIRTEERANKVLSSMMKSKGAKKKKEEKRRKKKKKEENTTTYDFFFGPKLFNKVGANRFLKYNQDGTRKDLWDAIMNPVLLEEKVGSVDVDYTYNSKQKKIEEDHPTVYLLKEDGKYRPLKGGELSFYQYGEALDKKTDENIIGEPQKALKFYRDNKINVRKRT